MALLNDPETIAPHHRLARQAQRILERKTADDREVRSTDVAALLRGVDQSRQAAAMRWLLVEQAAHVAADRHAAWPRATGLDGLAQDGARAVLEIMIRMRDLGEQVPYISDGPPAAGDAGCWGPPPGAR